VIKPGLFSGVWRLSGRRVTWLVEQPDRSPGGAKRLLQELTGDEDPVLRTLARATPAQEWIEWRAEDVWSRRRLHRDNIVLVGDAAGSWL
jgi:2-polyprenyl-6-methoxyphenol hydroxylase-like FAD-dependent oxidoreductase